MKPTIVFIAALAFLGLSSALSSTGWKYLFGEEKSFEADKDFLEKQKFLYEILHRINNPLLFEEYIKLGARLITEKDQYKKFDVEMTNFYKAYKSGALLPKGEFFGSLVKSHLEQSYGLFKFFCYPNTFETFQRNVCWARIHVNEGLLVDSLSMALRHCKDLKPLTLPSISEIFPEHFFNSKLIYRAGKFNYDTWNNYSTFENKFKDIIYDKEVEQREWPWWKVRGLNEQFYEEKEFIHRENMNQANAKQALNELKVFWTPAGYTSDIEMYNSDSKLAYFTEDVGLNEYWYQVSMEYPILLDQKTYELKENIRGTYYIFTVHSMLARHTMECTSNGHDPEIFSWFKAIKTGYNPHLVTVNGVGFNIRRNSEENDAIGYSDTYQSIFRIFDKIMNYVDHGSYTMADGTNVNLRKPQSIENVGSLLQGNRDAYDSPNTVFWTVITHMFFSGVNENTTKVDPDALLNYVTLLRDPIFYVGYRINLDVFYRFTSLLKPYSEEDLLVEGIKIENVEVQKLITYFDLVDFDISNLLNDEMTFNNGKYNWDKMLSARQMRLNHKPFNLTFTIESENATKVIISSFLGPKYDHFGRNITLDKNRKKFMKIDAFSYNLSAGRNVFNRSSDDFYGTKKDRKTYSELYKNLMSTIEGKDQLSDEFIDKKTHTKFPNRLLLPRGWVSGMPMQMFFMASKDTNERGYFSLYPFDRIIEDYNFFVPNMLLKEVKIFHEENIE